MPAYPLKVVDDVSRVAASEVGHGNADLLVVVVKVDADVLLQLLAAPQGGVNGILVDDPAVEQAVFWNLLGGGGRGGQNISSLARDSCGRRGQRVDSREKLNPPEICSSDDRCRRRP